MGDLFKCWVDFQKNLRILFKMRALLCFCLAAAVASIMVPVQTGSQRCLVIYSMNEEETIKIGLRFPNDTGVRQFYDYRFRVRDLAGGVVMDETISTLSWRTEVTVPNKTIYQACIGVLQNETKTSNSSVRFIGEVLVCYEANTYFMTEGNRAFGRVEGILQQQVTAMKSQVNDLINITRQFVQLQRAQRKEEVRQYQQKKQAEESIFEWWMMELLLICGLGAIQWGRMKRKIEGERYGH